MHEESKDSGTCAINPEILKNERNMEFRNKGIQEHFKILVFSNPN